MIKKRDIEAWGKTDGCPGCRALLMGKGNEATHTPECRHRMEQRMTAAGDTRIERYTERLTEMVNGGDKEMNGDEEHKERRRRSERRAGKE